MLEELKREALSYLEARHVMTLATTGAEGPWATALFFVNKDFTLYFFTEAHTRHGRNLAKNPAVAATIHEDYNDWQEIKGIQLSGEVHPVGPAEKARVVPLFVHKYKSLSAFLTRHPMAVVKAQIYKLVAREVWYLDNQKGFSKRQKLNLE